MEISKKELEKIMARQAAKAVQDSDERMDKRFQQWSKESDEKLKQWSKESDEKLRQWSKESDERMERYIGALKEDSNHAIQVITEQTRDIPKMREDIALLLEWKEEVGPKIDSTYAAVQDMKPRLDRIEARLDATFEEVGTMRVELDAIKQQLADLKNSTALSVSDKARIEELETRVEILERKVEVSP